MCSEKAVKRRGEGKIRGGEQKEGMRWRGKEKRR